MKIEVAGNRATKTRETTRKARTNPLRQQCQNSLVQRGHTTGVALGEKLRRVIDPDRQRLEAPRRRDVHDREQLPADRQRRLETRRDRSERRVFRHVFRILLIMLIGEMSGIVAAMRMVRLGRDRIVVMHKESAKRLVRMSHRKEQYDDEQKGSAVAQKGHQRRGQR